MTPLNVPLDEFLRPFFDPAETVCLRVFSDKKPTAFKGQKLECAAGKILTMEKTLRKHNSQNRGVYFVVNYGGHEDGEIERINAVFVENDTLPIPEQISRLETFTLPPSLMVKTAKSVHAYWLVKDVSVADFRGLQKGLIAQFDGDPACVNESRVLRLPGFYHCKGEPVMVECVKFAPELRYTKAQLTAVLPVIAEETVASGPVPKGNRKGLTQVGSRCEFIQHCKKNAVTLPENLWYAMITNLAVFEGGDKAIHALSKGYPKYSYTETEGKIRHFLDSGTKPITCRKIAEMGYKCTRLENGGCDCKSPAALCYKPLTTDELLAVLESLKIPGTAIEKIQTIKAFILDYLYNIVPVIAETLLAHKVNMTAAEVSGKINIFHFGIEANHIFSALQKVAEYQLQQETFSLSAVSEDEDVGIGLVLGAAFKIHDDMAAEFVMPEAEAVGIGLAGIAKGEQIRHG